MKLSKIYQQAINNGVEYIGCCVELNGNWVQMQLNKARNANQKIVEKIIKNTDILDSEFFKYGNPYNHYINDSYIIYRHSAIEYFFKVL